MTEKQIIRKALTINKHLNNLRKECENLIEEIEIFGDEVDYDTYIYELRNLKYTLQDLADFDLEDSIALAQ